MSWSCSWMSRCPYHTMKHDDLPLRRHACAPVLILFLALFPRTHRDTACTAVVCLAFSTGNLRESPWGFVGLGPPETPSTEHDPRCSNFWGKCSMQQFLSKLLHDMTARLAYSPKTRYCAACFGVSLPCFSTACSCTS